MNKKQYYKMLDEKIKANRARKNKLRLMFGLLDCLKYIGGFLLLLFFAWLFAAFLYTC